VPVHLSFFINFSINGILGSHLPSNSSCGITTPTVR
jgi:hypothetical protein